MIKTIVFLCTFLLFSIPVLSGKAHSHSDSCYTGHSHYHLDSCKTKANYLPKPNTSCATCGGDGFLESNCNGTYISAVRASDRLCGYYYLTGSGITLDNVIESSCNKCGEIIYAGNSLLLFPQQDFDYYASGGSFQTYIDYNNLIPFYQTIGNLSLGQHHRGAYGRLTHTLTRCPDCMGECYVCAYCGGEYIHEWGGTNTVPCRGTIVRKDVTTEISHGLYGNYGYQYGTHYKTISYFYESCQTCDAIHSIPSNSVCDALARCDDCGGSSNYSWPDPIRRAYNQDSSFYTRSGNTCTTRYETCQHCYMGAENFVPNCGKRTGIYYDTSGNICSSICEKVVNNIEFMKSII